MNDYTKFPRRSIRRETATYTLPLNLVRNKTTMALLGNGSASAGGAAFVIVPGAPGTNTPTLSSRLFSGAGATSKCRLLWELPIEYVDGGAITIRTHVTSPDLSVGGNHEWDIICYVSDNEGGATGDLCSTSAQDYNTSSYTNLDWTITPTSRVSGEILDIQVTLKNTTWASGDGYGDIGAIQFIIPVKG